MVNLLDNDHEDRDNVIKKFSILIIPVILLIIDKYFVTIQDNHIIIGDTALTTRDLLILTLFALALVALMRPMDHKKFVKPN